MARHRPSPTAPPAEPPTAEENFHAGMMALVADASWRWATRHMGLAEEGGLTQRDVAIACGIDEAQFGRYLNRGRRITLDALVRMRRGFQQLAARHRFEYAPPEEPDDRSLAVAGWLHAINEEGRGQGVPPGRRPVGVVHYYCLRLMCASPDWHRAAAGGYGPADLTRLASETWQVARREAAEVRHVLEDYAAADRTNPVGATHAALRDLRRVWTGPWRVVYTRLGDGP